MMGIKELRIFRGLSQKELAEKLGISAQQLNNYESGARNPGNKMLPALADALGVSASYLRGDAQKLAVYNWVDDETSALPIVSEAVIDGYGMFYLVEHPDCGIIAVIQSDGLQFTPSDWQGEQPETPEDIASARWVNNRGDDAIMFEGLPRILVGGEFGQR